MAQRFPKCANLNIVTSRLEMASIIYWLSRIHASLSDVPFHVMPSNRIGQVSNAAAELHAVFYARHFITCFDCMNEFGEN